MAALIRCGKLCRHCTPTECKDKSTDEMPLEIECPNCSGYGCDECDDGMTTIPGCPSEYCGPLGSTTALIDLFEQGLPPIAGGALDQAYWFVQAARILKNDEAKIRTEAING